MFARRTWQYVATPKTRNWHQDINPQTSPVKQESNLSVTFFWLQQS